MRRRVWRPWMIDCEYESCWSQVPLLRRAIDTRVKIPQSSELPCRGEFDDWSVHVHDCLQASRVATVCGCSRQ